MIFFILPIDNTSNIGYTLIKIRDKEKPRMTEEQIKQVEEKLETLRTMIKKAASNGNYPSVNRTKSKIDGISFMLNLLGYKITLEDNQTKLVEM